MWQLITIPGLLGLGAAALAVWRYFFSLDLPVNLTVNNTRLGQSYCDGRQQSDFVSYEYYMANCDARDIQIGEIKLHRQTRFGCIYFWCRARNSRLHHEVLPHRLPPNGGMDIHVTIEKSDVGVHRLRVRAYTSFRRASLLLSELEHVPS
jgi:hypothetical protein